MSQIAPDSQNHASHMLDPANDQGEPGSSEAGSNIFQPKANNRPQGQLAAFLRGRFDHLEGDFQTGEMNRSNSAPPTQLPNNVVNSENEIASDDPRLDPSYAAFYYEHSRLDPRLPPPLYAPGQSWQMWSGPGLAAALANNSSNGAAPVPKDLREAFSRFKAQRDEAAGGRDDGRSGAGTPRGGPWAQGDGRPFAATDALPPNRRRNLVDMIQDDFPRTPSPVFAQQKSRLASGKNATTDETDQNRSAEATAAAIATSLSVSTTSITSPSAGVIDYAGGQRRSTRTPNAASVLDDDQSAADHEHLRSVMNAALEDMQAEQRITSQPQAQRPIPHHLGPQLMQRYGTPSTAASMARAFSLRQRLSPPPRANSTPPSNQLFGRLTSAGSVPPGYGMDEETELMMAMRGMTMDGSVSREEKKVTAVHY
ncbi:hypothetical protein BDF19DRAFT_17981 [Syncephalis fuscata]|nr:hypothetical protein BDF19DRAFT_17981 [Syncephalis fuscata]